jgi:hypothetical protein
VICVIQCISNILLDILYFVDLHVSYILKVLSSEKLHNNNGTYRAKVYLIKLNNYMTYREERIHTFGDD